MCGPRPVGSRGSSPHTRGARLRRGLRAARQGIIPAYAGSTVSLDVCRLMVPGSSPHTRGAPASKTPRCGSGRDHPRIRGEHQRAYPSPRGQARIIPAYAGSTDPSEAQVVRLIGSSPHTRGALTRAGAASGSGGDHPRIRGEHRVENISTCEKLGIIPAYAGSTPSALMRSRGLMGSSPHTRGAQFFVSVRAARKWDHPRIRGEHHAPVLHAVALEGIIPAYAGSTITMSYTTCVNVGSSPHTRGAL